MLTTTCCSGSLVDIVWYGYCNLFVNDVMKHNQVSLPLSVLLFGEVNISS